MTAEKALTMSRTENIITLIGKLSSSNVVLKKFSYEDGMDITNDCRKPPPRLLWHVRRALSWINQDHLKGLGFIWLMDHIPETTEDENAKRALAGELLLYGAYGPQKGRLPSYVLLLTQYVYLGIPAFYSVTPVPTLRIVKTLAHEVAHHLIATRGYVFQPGEDLSDQESLANRYAAGVLQDMMKRWHYKLGRWLINDLAETNYAFGAIEWQKQRYCAAADRWHKAWALNPELEDIADLYWQAKDMCDGEQSPTRMAHRTSG